MRVLESTKRGFYNYMTGIALASVRRELLTRDDCFMANNGFSRQLLEQGVSAWPWRVCDANSRLESTEA